MQNRFSVACGRIAASVVVLFATGAFAEGGELHSLWSGISTGAPAAYPAEAACAVPGVESLMLEGENHEGRPTRFFAYYGFPTSAAGKGPVPGMVLVHGGNGTAYAWWVKLWNDRGYAAIAMDTCGALPVKDPATKKWKRHAWSGPEGWGGFAETDRPMRDQWPYQAVADVIRAHSYLRTRPGVDPSRIGLTGISWGGYLSCLAAGADSRFRFVAPVYGCGFFDDCPKFKAELDALGERGRKWLSQWDASLFLPQATCPFLWVSGKDDYYFTYVSLLKSAELVRAGSHFAVRGHLDHGHDVGSRQEEIFAFADAQFGIRRGLRGRVSDIWTRIDESNARIGEGEKMISLSAWRNERVHAQVVLWSADGAKGVRLSASELKTESGAVIPASSLRFRRIRPVPARIPDKRRSPPRNVGDCLEDVSDADVPSGGWQAVWCTVSVPADARPGLYRGSITAAADGESVAFPVTLKVSAETLPPAAERKFFLDLWQHPWSVAAYHRSKPFSAEHFAAMEPLCRELAAAGQKVITTSIVDLPWGEDYGEGREDIRSMVGYVRREDGTYSADFTDFDRYVEFAKRCGLGPQIHCYSIIKFCDHHIFYYTDARTGERCATELREGTKEYEAFLTPLLRQLVDHLKEKGWLADARIGIDEVPPDRFVPALAFLKRVAPELKVALACNMESGNYAGLECDVDVFSQILWKDFMSPAFFAKMKARKAQGRTTTFYVCTQPQKPNTWMRSPLAETEWIGLYSAAKGFDGFLRWAAFLWPSDPWDSTSTTGYPAGEDTLLYPGAQASVRWEILRDSIEDWEKIRILRESGRLTPALASALDALDFRKAEASDEQAIRAANRAVLDELNRF